MDNNSKAKHAFKVVVKPVKLNMQNLRISLVIGGIAKHSSRVLDLTF
jgi:hypothetical protein